MDRGLLIIVSGFSGAGKGSIVKKLISKYDNYALSISATTRQPRNGETDGKEYFFVSKETFENFKATSDAFVGPIVLPYFGPAVSISIARKAKITCDKNGAEIESIKEDEIYSITDQAVIDYCKSISSEHSEYSPSEFIKTFLYQMKEYQGWEFVRNDTDDGYVYVSKLSEPYSNYFKYTDSPDLLIEYVINPENNKYAEITVFSEDAEDQSGIFDMVDCLDAIKDKFDDAIFDESNKCYNIPMIYFLGNSKEIMELDNIDAIKDQYIQLYFANGRVSKLTVDLGDVTEFSGATSFTFTSYGDANVAFPVVTNTCTHPGCDYVVNDNYHYTRCSECGSVLTYEKHQYVEGEWDGLLAGVEAGRYDMMINGCDVTDEQGALVRETAERCKIRLVQLHKQSENNYSEEELYTPPADFIHRRVYVD